MALQCPPFKDFCEEFNSRCPNDCNGRGLCSKIGQCLCYTGFSGIDCSTTSRVDYAAIVGGYYSNRNAKIASLAILFAALLAAVSL